MNHFENSFPLGLLFLVIPSLIFSAGQREYWQQHVAYEIHVTLNDSAHTLDAHERLTYTNHSPDTLSFLWFHLWPNAYRNKETAFAKQKLDQYSTRFFYADEEERGYIDSLDFTIGSSRLKWEYHPDWIDVAKVYLPKRLAPGDSVTIQTPFFVKLPRVFSRLGHTGRHYEITQWYPKPAVYDREGWHPMPYLDMGEFYSEFGTFDVTVTLPENYRIMATGDLVAGEDEIAWLDSLAAEGDSLHALRKKEFRKRIKEMRKSGRGRKTKGRKEDQERPLKTVRFHQENVHDFAWFADPDWIVRKGELRLPAGADSTRKVTLWSMYLPKNAKLWENSIEYIHDAGYWFSKFYGDYPYNHITAVDGDLSAGGGMEYPNITVISSGGSKDLLEFVIMHEVGHNWFYGILGSNERDHAFLDEGLNEYTNIRYWEKKYPERDGAITVVDFVQNKLGIARHLDIRWAMAYLGYQIRAVAGDDQPIDLTSTDFDRSNYGTVVYGKTGIFTRYLQHYLGERKTDEVMQDYYETWKYKHPSPSDFRDSFTRHVDENLSWYFNDAIHGTKVIDYSVRFGGGGRVLVENHGTMSPPVELAFFGNDGAETGRVWMSGFEGTQSVPLPGGVKRVIIDPDNYMPDINRANNSTSKGLKVHLVFDQPTFHDTEVNLLPWLGWNAYHGTTPGFVGYSGFIPGFRTGFSISPQWDFKHARPVGSLTIQRTMYKILGFRTVVASARASDYAGGQGGTVAFKGTIRKPIVSTPSISLKSALHYRHIKSDAVNPVYYTPGNHSVMDLGATYEHRPTPFIRYSAGGGLMVGLGDRSFSRFHLMANVSWRYQRKLTLQLRSWLGGFVTGGDIPAHYKIWMSGGVDPNFENNFALNRTDDGGKGPVNIYDDQFISRGPALRGLLDKASTATAWGVNVDHSLPFVPVALFADMAGAADLRDTFVDGGLKLSLGAIVLYLPLYESWEPQNVASSFTWITSRARFELALPSIRIGR